MMDIITTITIDQGKTVGGMKIITTISTKTTIITDREKQVFKSIVHIVLQDRILSKKRGTALPFTSG